MAKSLTSASKGLRRFILLLLLMMKIMSASGVGIRSSSVLQLQSNMWREAREAVFKTERHHTLYGKDRHCVPPDPPEQVEIKSHDNASWSSLFSRYTLDAGDELDVWLANQESYNETKDEKHEESALDVLIPIGFPIFFALFLTISVAVIPFIGALAFQVLMIFWWTVTHDEIKRCGRRALILNETVHRKRQRILMPDSVKTPPTSRFHLPHFFRLYPEEDIPTELDEPEEDEWMESEGEVENKGNADGASLSGLNTETSEEEEILEESNTNINNDQQSDQEQEQK